ncbi:hypothetical protein [Tissierella sp.]|uniref:hypothetical protein n=1 Tax=Tissierella sp. TaxID=41274 RepID=UPI002856DC93|nr:hypothetical protein [Tissierella sp.]MDR7855175.1 hypothetical protein [Tissierella sp.]
MKNTKMIKITIMLSLLLTLSACTKKNEGNKVIVDENGSTIVIVDDNEKGAGEPVVSVQKIDKLQGVELSDWLDEETVIVSKENDSLDKMDLLELSSYYPRSLYQYNINSKEYQLLKEEKNLFLGGATLSADKKHLLYYEFSLGDPAYVVLNLDTLDSFSITGENIAGATSANWAGNEVLGSTYSNNAYKASTRGEISILEDLDEAPLIIRKINGNIYYNTYFDQSLIMINQGTKEKIKLNMESVYDVIPSPDENKMLVLQDNATKKTLILSDIDGSNQKIIAEGTEIGGVSWSPDQGMIAYNLKGNTNNTIVNGLNVYDMLTDESTQIAVDIQNAITSWSPSGEKLVYAEWDGEQYNSSIVYLKYSIQK